MNNPIKSVRMEILISGFTETPLHYDTGWRQLPCNVLSYLFVPGGGSEGSPGAVLQRRGLPDVQIPVGGLMLVPAREEHRVKTVGEGVFSLWMHFSALCGPGVELTELYEFPRLCFAPETMEKMPFFLREVFERSNSGEPADEIRAVFAASAAVAELFPYARLKREMVLDELRRVAPAIRLIRSAPEKRYPAEELAAECYLSESRFRAIFREIMGLTAHEFAENERIQLAVRYLQQGFSVEEIAVKLAYSDASHFSRTFRKMTGMAPGSYRKFIFRQN